MQIHSLIIEKVDREPSLVYMQGATLHLRHVMNAFACIIMQKPIICLDCDHFSKKKNSSKTNEIDEMWVDEKSCVI